MVPEGWKPTQLGDLGKFSSGGTPSKQRPEYWGGNFPWISGKDLKSHYLLDSILKLSKAGFENAKIAPKGASLVLVRGMTLLKDFPVGYATREMAFNQDLKAIIPAKDVDSLYLSYLLSGNKEYIKQLVSTAGHGTGRLDTESLKAFPVNKPPLQEQVKIAQILFVWDKAITTTEHLLSNSQKQKKALMQQLLTGKKRFPGFVGEWVEVSIKDIGKIVSGGTPDTKSNNYWGGNVLWMTPTDVTALKTRFIIDTKRKITKEGIQNSSASIVPPGSLLVCTRATVGEMSISTTDITTNQGFKTLIPNGKFDVNYLYYLFVFHKTKFIKYACGSTFLELSKKDFEKLSFKCPELKEQQGIASILSAADSEIEVLQQDLNNLKQEKKALMQQLLTGKRRVSI